jgi:RNA polymerase sigma factor (sigma-70 family)
MSCPAGCTGVQRNIKGFRQGGSTGRGKPVDRDWTLVEALRRRESTVAERRLETYGDRLYRLARRITGNEQDAEEVVQDAFWSVVQNIDTSRGESLFGSWIYRITANTAYQKQRGAARRRDEIALDQVLPTLDDSHQHVDPSGDWLAKIDAPAIQSESRDGQRPEQPLTGVHSRPRIEHGARNGLPVTCCIYWVSGRTPFFNQYMTARSRLLR